MGFAGIGADVRYSLRTLVKRPAFAIVAVTTLALAIGSSTAIFAFVNGLLLRPLPYADPSRLVFVSGTNSGNRMSFSWADFLDVRARARSFESLAGSKPASFTVTGAGRPARVDGRLAGWNLLDVLGVRPQLGRTFAPSDDETGATPVAIVSDRFWRQNLGADPSVIGRMLRTDEATFTVVGVLPRSWRFPQPFDILAPIGTALPASGGFERGRHIGLYGVGRLARGTDVAQANAELESIAADLARTYPATDAGNGVRAQPFGDVAVERVRDTLVALMAAVGFLLLLAAVNVANLQIARGAGRRRELAIRSAIGGTRARLVRQLLVESVLLSAAGGALGLLAADWLLGTMLKLAPSGLARLDDVAIDAGSIGFAAAAAAVSGVVFGTFAALQAVGGGELHLIARASHGSGAIGARRTRRGLLAIEVALALVLLAACSLMAETVARLNAVDPGFDPEHVLAARVVLTGDRWTAERRRAFFDELSARVAAIPGVARAGLTLSLPTEGAQWGSGFTVEDRPAPPRDEMPEAYLVAVSPTYFQAIGVPLKRGRTFGASDSAEAAPVAILSESLAKELWPGGDAAGKRLKLGWPEEAGAWRTIVGVVGDVKLNGVDREAPPQVYLPLAQEPVQTVAIVARTTIEPMAVAASIAAAVDGLDRTVPLDEPRPMTDVMTTSIARQRASTVVLIVLAAVALAIAAVGLYGVTAQGVTDRTREIGVRIALGAERRQVLWLFVRQGLSTSAAGAAIGIGTSVPTSRVLDSLLFGVRASDPLTLASVACTLLGVAALACYLPARRAARVDPLNTLRSE